MGIFSRSDTRHATDLQQRLMVTDIKLYQRWHIYRMHTNRIDMYRNSSVVELHIPLPKYRCIMRSRKLRNNRWRHRCVKCGIIRESNRPNYVRRCDKWQRGLGTKISRMLSLVGITPARVSHWLGQPCGCEARRQWLDRLVPWL